MTWTNDPYSHRRFRVQYTTCGGAQVLAVVERHARQSPTVVQADRLPR